MNRVPRMLLPALVALVTMTACAAESAPVLSTSAAQAPVGAVAVAAPVTPTPTPATTTPAKKVTFSVWARKPHQALLPTYALLGLWIGAVPLGSSLNRAGGGIPTVNVDQPPPPHQ